MRLKAFKKIPQVLAIAFMFLCFFSVLPNTSAADVSYTLLEPLIVPGGETINETDNIGKYLAGIFKLGIGIASVLAVLMIVIGGLQYMTTDKIQLKGDAKSTITNALWGLVLVLASYLLLQTINKDLVIFTLDLEDVASVEVKNSGGGVDVTTTQDILEDAAEAEWVGKCTCASGPSSSQYNKSITTIFGSTSAECKKQCDTAGANKPATGYYNCYISANCSKQ